MVKSGVAVVPELLLTDQQVQGALFYQQIATPLGQIYLLSDESALLGADFVDSRYQEARLHALKQQPLQRENSVLTAAAAFYEDYFAGKKPPVSFPLRLVGTPFLQAVWQALATLPYGTTCSYSDLTAKVAATLHRPDFHGYRAVGQAIGSNPFIIMLPCHRVVSSSGKLTGFSAGIERKAQLLAFERGELTQFSYP